VAVARVDADADLDANRFTNSRRSAGDSAATVPNTIRAMPQIA
jgi:hypothetical protein